MFVYKYFGSDLICREVSIILDSGILLLIDNGYFQCLIDDTG